MSPPVESPASPSKRRLTIATGEPGRAERHPDDGFPLADPRPFDPLTESVARAMIRAILPPPPAPRPEGIEDTILTHLRVMTQYMPFITGTGFFVLLHLLNFSPLWRGKKLATITRLDPEEASHILHDVASSKLLFVRMMMLAPKALIMSTYFDQDEIHEALRYDPKGFTKERIDFRKRLLDGLAPRPEDMLRRSQVASTTPSTPKETAS